MSDEPAVSPDLREAARLFPVRLSDDVRRSIRHEGDPVALQYLADARETVVLPEERPDPIGDHAHSPVKGIVHRHSDRVLFKIASVCAVNCRFCFRKTMLGTPEETLSAAETETALGYIERTPAIREVILTGGDPLVLSSRRLGEVLRRLDQIGHVQILRIHSRIPVAAPSLVNDELLSVLDCTRPLYMVLHVNHIQELTGDAAAAIGRLRQRGVVLLSQSVLLKNINDSAEALEALFRRLLELRVKPYYLHHPDLVPGTGHFRVGIETGQAIMRELRGRLTGLGLPTYVLDIPGGFGKVPLEGAWIETDQGQTVVVDVQGRRHIYP